MKLKELPVSAASDAIDLIGKEWMLIGVADGESANAMTASWGTLGTLWNKPVCICYIRPQRHTFGLAENEDRLSFSFFGSERRDALAHCGKYSGRDSDKLKDAGLDYEMADGVPVFDDARLTLVCRKLYAGDLLKEGFLDPSLLSHYKQEDYHRMYVCEIEKVYTKA